MAFDIIGDIHGHADTLEVLLRKLGYVSKFGVYQHPEQRKVAFVDNLIERIPKIRETLQHTGRTLTAQYGIIILAVLQPTPTTLR